MRLVYKLKWRLAAWLVLALLLAACASAAQPATEAVPTQPAAPATASQAETQPQATVAAAETTVVAAEATVVAAEATVAAVEPATASSAQSAIATEFTPSDPAQVNLAAGRPQLVEFFAFW